MPRVVHLSDLHHQLDWRLRSLASTGWRGAPGRFELQALRRQERFPGTHERIRRLVDAAAAHEADCVLLTGDLTALGDEEELAAVRTALEPLIQQGRLAVVPGNHDRYTSATRARRFERYFGALLASDLPEYAGRSGYPFVRLLEPPLALVGLDTTNVPGLGHYFFGRIGRPQLAALGRLLDDPRLAGRTVLLLLHHAPSGPDGRFSWRESALLDGAALYAVLRDRPVVIHHGHSHFRYWHRRGDGRPHQLGGGSATERGREGYWLVELDDHRHLEARALQVGTE